MAARVSFGILLFSVHEEWLLGNLSTKWKMAFAEVLNEILSSVTTCAIELNTVCNKIHRH